MKYYFYFCRKLPYYHTSDIYKTITLGKKKEKKGFFTVSNNSEKDICLVKLTIDMKINTQNKGMSLLEKYK